MRDHVSSNTFDRQNAVNEQLIRLQEEGYISELSIEVWGKQVCVDTDRRPMVSDEVADDLLTTYREFKSWAERAGCSLEPGFSEQTLESLITDDRGTVIRFPIMCLAAYDGDNLIDIAPRSSAEGVYTITDMLDTLRPARRHPVGVEQTGQIESG